MLPFEMRTVLSGICLFIDTNKIIRQHFISNRNGGEESKIAERQTDRERERERERESACVCEAAHGGKGEIVLVIK
jgi:hypothetical protein